MIGSVEATGHVYSQPEAKPLAAVEVSAAQPLSATTPDAAMATYMPIRMSYETDANVVVMQYQNVTSGEVKRQIPEPAMLATYRSRAALGSTQETADKGTGARTGFDTSGNGASPEAQPTGLGLGGAGAPAATGPAPMGSSGAGLAAPERPVGGAASAPVKTTA